MPWPMINFFPSQNTLLSIAKSFMALAIAVDFLNIFGDSDTECSVCTKGIYRRII